MAYWDTSCLIKLYVFEPDSASFRAHALMSGPIAIAQLGRLELLTALFRKESLGQIKAGTTVQSTKRFDEDVARGRVVVEPLNSAVVSEFNAVVQHCYAQNLPIQIRTLDALHLATAAVLRESEIVATDARLRAAAASLRFGLFPPES